ncbi:MAG: sulfotransferase family protein [Actinomycetota bacterium]|nr:sulfotransferase family protein [Actinomycetota bacterium]
MHSKPIALWAVPRSVSTALERVFVERGDFKVFHEPFSASYYYSPERRSDRFAGTEPKEEYRYEKILKRMLEVEEKPVYFKDMAYHVAGFMSAEFISRFTNTFIIREPTPVIASLYRFWPDFTLEEAGYEQQHRLFDLAVKNGEDPAVVDAADLTGDPEGTIRAYCEKLDVEFMPEALSWESGEVPGWEMWTEWHEEAQESTGIKSQPLEDDMEIPASLQGVYEHCLPYYKELHEKRLHPAR